MVWRDGRPVVSVATRSALTPPAVHFLRTQLGDPMLSVYHTTPGEGCKVHSATFSIHVTEIICMANTLVASLGFLPIATGISSEE